MNRNEDIEISKHDKVWPSPRLLLAHGRLPTICNEQQGRPTSTSDSLLVRIRISHINWFSSGRGYDRYGHSLWRGIGSSVIAQLSRKMPLACNVQ